MWQPAARTAERRELFSACQGVVKECTRLQQQIKGMLNEHCIRLESGFRLTLPSALPRLLARKEWTTVQRILLSQLHAGLVSARARRQLLRRDMARDIVGDQSLLRLARLTGLNLVSIYGLTSAIGDVTRFSHSKKLVAYLGLNPSVCESGNWQGGTALKRHGRGPIRALLVQAAQKLLRVPNPLQKGGLNVAQRRGSNKAAVAVARKLAVAAWHVLIDHPIGAIEKATTLETKVFKLATELGTSAIADLGFTSKTDFITKKLYVLKQYP